MHLLIFIIGAIMGSFYLVVGTRLPKDEDVIKSRSKCDNCGKTLKWYNLIPLFSFLFQRGKCSFCHKKIASEHFWVELITGILFLTSYLIYGFSYEFFICLIIISLTILVFVSDFKYMIILDSPLVISTILVIILKYIYFDINEVLISILSGILMFLVMILIKKLGNYLFKKESLGDGDIKLSFVIGLILNFKLSIIVLLLSTFLALPYSIASLYITKNNQVPYGPFLCGALLIVFLTLEKFNILFDFLFSF